MKSIISAALLALVSVAAAPVANAATGSFDGAYSFEYDAMNLTVQCGYVDNYYQVVDGGIYHYAFPLTGEALPADVFDAQLAWRLEAIEAMNLRPAAEVAAKLNAYAFFTGLRHSLDRMVEEYPQGMEVSLNDNMTTPYSSSYFFNGMMKDEADQDLYNLVGQASTVTGAFGILPMLWAESGVDYDGIGHRVSLGVQVGGNFNRGYGAARWQAQQLSAVDYGYGYGAVWGCGVSTLTGFELSREGSEPTEVSRHTGQADASSVKLDARATRELKQQVRLDAVQQLKASSSLDKKSLQAADMLSRTLAR